MARTQPTINDMFYELGVIEYIAGYISSFVLYQATQEQFNQYQDGRSDALKETVDNTRMFTKPGRILNVVA